MKKLWNDQSGIMTFEWILLFTLVVLGIVGGLAAVRDAYILKAADTAGAVVAVNQSYGINASLGATVSFAGKTTTISGMTSTSYKDSGGSVTTT